MMNPNWIRTTIASILLAILLRVGLGVPFLTTFVTIGIIFLTHIVFTELGTGVTTAWMWTKFAGNMVIGVVIFLALRFIVGGVIGIYPIDTYGTIDSAGGLYGLLPSRNIPKVIMWEILFAFVAGGLAVAWTKGKRGTVGVIFAVSLIILTVQIALPDYVKTWPNRDTVSTTLINNGVVGGAAKGTWVLLFGKPKQSSLETANYVVARPQAPLDECSTPCAMHVGWDTEIKSGDKPVLIKFYGKTEWLRFSGRGDEKFTLDQFSPGKAQFASPENAPVVLVQLFPAK